MTQACGSLFSRGRPRRLRLRPCRFETSLAARLEHDDLRRTRLHGASHGPGRGADAHASRTLLSVVEGRSRRPPLRGGRERGRGRAAASRCRNRRRRASPGRSGRRRAATRGRAGHDGQRLDVRGVPVVSEGTGRTRAAHGRLRIGGDHERGDLTTAHRGHPLALERMEREPSTSSDRLVHRGDCDRHDCSLDLPARPTASSPLRPSPEAGDRRSRRARPGRPGRALCLVGSTPRTMLSMPLANPSTLDRRPPVAHRRRSSSYVEELWSPSLAQHTRNFQAKAHLYLPGDFSARVHQGSFSLWRGLNSIQCLSRRASPLPSGLAGRPSETKKATRLGRPRLACYAARRPSAHASQRERGRTRTEASRRRSSGTSPPRRLPSHRWGAWRW